MSEPNPPRRPLATFLRTAPAPSAAGDAPAQDALALPDTQRGSDTVDDGADTADSNTFALPDADEHAHAASGQDAGHVQPHSEEAIAGHVHAHVETETLLAAQAHAAPSPQRGDPQVPLGAAGETPAPGFLKVPVARLHTPRWQWTTIAVLAVLLLLQIVLADRARLAADAGNRPWVTALCGVLRCSLPAWHEPTAFTMVNRDIRPVPGQPGTLQVLASLRNDARWAQAWPDLRLSLSDADGRVIGSAVFSAEQYLGQNAADAGLIEPGQSAQVAFRVREPAASTVAFTFEFL